MRVLKALVVKGLCVGSSMGVLTPCVDDSGDADPTCGNSSAGARAAWMLPSCEDPPDAMLTDPCEPGPNCTEIILSGMQTPGCDAICRNETTAHRCRKMPSSTVTIGGFDPCLMGPLQAPCATTPVKQACYAIAFYTSEKVETPCNLTEVGYFKNHVRSLSTMTTTITPTTGTVASNGTTYVTLSALPDVEGATGYCLVTGGAGFGEVTCTFGTTCFVGIYAPGYAMALDVVCKSGGSTVYDNTLLSDGRGTKTVYRSATFFELPAQLLSHPIGSFEAWSLSKAIGQWLIVLASFLATLWFCNVWEKIVTIVGWVQQSKANRGIEALMTMAKRKLKREEDEETVDYIVLIDGRPVKTKNEYLPNSTPVAKSKLVGVIKYALREKIPGFSPSDLTRARQSSRSCLGRILLAALCCFRAEAGYLRSQVEAAESLMKGLSDGVDFTESGARAMGISPYEAQAQDERLDGPLTGESFESAHGLVIRAEVAASGLRLQIDGIEGLSSPTPPRIVNARLLQECGSVASCVDACNTAPNGYSNGHCCNAGACTGSGAATYSGNTAQCCPTLSCSTTTTCESACNVLEDDWSNGFCCVDGECTTSGVAVYSGVNEDCCAGPSIVKSCYASVLAGGTTSYADESEALGHVGNGICNHGHFNIASCNWDGGDCCEEEAKNVGECVPLFDDGPSCCRDPKTGFAHTSTAETDLAVLLGSHTPTELANEIASCRSDIDDLLTGGTAEDLLALIERAAEASSLLHRMLQEAEEATTSSAFSYGVSDWTDLSSCTSTLAQATGSATVSSNGTALTMSSLSFSFAGFIGEESCIEITGVEKTSHGSTNVSFFGKVSILEMVDEYTLTDVYYTGTYNTSDLPESLFQCAGAIVDQWCDLSATTSTDVKDDPTLHSSSTQVDNKMNPVFFFADHIVGGNYLPVCWATYGCTIARANVRPSTSDPGDSIYEVSTVLGKTSFMTLGISVWSEGNTSDVTYSNVTVSAGTPIGFVAENTPATLEIVGFLSGGRSSTWPDEWKVFRAPSGKTSFVGPGADRDVLDTNIPGGSIQAYAEIDLWSVTEDMNTQIAPNLVVMEPDNARGVTATWKADRLAQVEGLLMPGDNSSGYYADGDPFLGGVLELSENNPRVSSSWGNPVSVNIAFSGALYFTTKLGLSNPAFCGSEPKLSGTYGDDGLAVLSFSASSSSGGYVSATLKCDDDDPVLTGFVLTADCQAQSIRFTASSEIPSCSLALSDELGQSSTEVSEEVQGTLAEAVVAKQNAPTKINSVVNSEGGGVALVATDSATGTVVAASDLCCEIPSVSVASPIGNTEAIGIGVAAGVVVLVIVVIVVYCYCRRKVTVGMNPGSGSYTPPARRKAVRRRVVGRDEPPSREYPHQAGRAEDP